MPMAPKHHRPVIRLVLIDKNEIMRAGLRTILEETAGFQVVGEANSLAELVPLSSGDFPEIVIQGISSDRSNMLKDFQKISAQFPKASLMLLACDTDELNLLMVSKAVEASCFLKDVKSAELIRALRMMATGTRVVDPKLFTAPLQPIQGFSDLDNEVKIHPLSHIEREVVTMIAHDKTDEEIARAMNVTEKTIKKCLYKNFLETQHLTANPSGGALCCEQDLTSKLPLPFRL